jgi:hypothetical protein
VIVFCDTSALFELLVEEEHLPDVEQAADDAEVRFACFDLRLRKAALALDIQPAG